MNGGCMAYWSSSPREDRDDGVWLVGFRYGLVYHYCMADYGYVRCVRRGE